MDVDGWGAERGVGGQMGQVGCVGGWAGESWVGDGGGNDAAGGRDCCSGTGAREDGFGGRGSVDGGCHGLLDARGNVGSKARLMRLGEIVNHMRESGVGSAGEELDERVQRNVAVDERVVCHLAVIDAHYVLSCMVPPASKPTCLVCVESRRDCSQKVIRELRGPGI